MQEHVGMGKDRLIKAPWDIPDEMNAFTEIVSVCAHTIARFHQFSHEKKDRIGIWGDGNLGYIVAALLSELYADCELYIMGIHEEKLATFTFAEQVFHVNNIPEGLKIDHAFECVGGSAAQGVIEQIIAHINPEGSIALMGVSENAVPIHTRMVLEKGLRMFGSSRSGRIDFVRVTELYEKYPRLKEYFLNLVNRVIEVRNVNDMLSAFEYDLNHSFGKTIMEWNV